MFHFSWKNASGFEGLGKCASFVLAQLSIPTSSGSLSCHRSPSHPATPRLQRWFLFDESTHHQTTLGLQKTTGFGIFWSFFPFIYQEIQEFFGTRPFWGIAQASCKHQQGIWGTFPGPSHFNILYIHGLYGFFPLRCDERTSVLI